MASQGAAVGDLAAAVGLEVERDSYETFTTCIHLAAAQGYAAGASAAPAVGTGGGSGSLVAQPLAPA
jgi:hypothetical protein